ncbi:ABC-2 transporter permease [Bacillus sp. FSL W7-1360]
MKGLLLSQYYSVEKSLKMYIALSVAIVGIVFLIQNENWFFFAAYIPMVLISSPAAESLKHESMSGWHKLMLTMPLKRNHVVQSHYFFYVMTVLLGLVVTVVLFTVAELVAGGFLTVYTISWMVNGLGVTLVLGSVTYPLTYKLGIEKSQAAVVTGVITAIGLFIFSRILYEIIVSHALQEALRELLFSSLFLVMTLVLFILSYFIAVLIYKRKEF